ncbi:MAG: hypothetical protein ACYC09_03035 [Bacteroidota bacterium]
MKRTVDIIAVLMLVVYGTLTLVIVPMHHHAMQYVDIPQYHTATHHQSVDCGICTFAATTVLVETPAFHTLLDRSEISTLMTGTNEAIPSHADQSFSRRGPPSFSV